jgi:iron(III) transport system permease protein
MKRILAGLLLTTLATPLLYLLIQAIPVGDDFEQSSLSIQYLSSSISTTSALVALSSFLALCIGCTAAIAVTFLDFPGRRFIEPALNLPFILPPYLLAMIYRWLAHRHYEVGVEVENIWGASILFALSLYPYVYLPLKITLENQSSSFIEMGRSLGLNRRKLIRKVIIPLCMPSLFAGFLLISMAVLSDYGMVSYLGLKTFSVVIHEVWFSFYKPQLAALLSVLSMLVPLMIMVVFWWSTRALYFHNPSNRPQRYRLKKLSAGKAVLTSVILSLPVVLGFILPASLLAQWCFKTMSKMKLESLFSDISQTIILCLSVTIPSLIFALILSAVGRTKKRGLFHRITSAVISLNFAVPAMVLSVSFLFLTRDLANSVFSPILSDSILLIIVANIFRYLGFAYFSIESGMRGLSSQLDETALSLHKGKWFLFFKIHLPLLKRHLVIGGLLVYICVARELTLSLVLQPFDYSSLSLRIYSLAGVDALQKSSVYAICLILISIYPVFSIGQWFKREKSPYHD